MACFVPDLFRPLMLNEKRRSRRLHFRFNTLAILPLNNLNLHSDEEDYHQTNAHRNRLTLYPTRLCWLTVKAQKRVGLFSALLHCCPAARFRRRRCSTVLEKTVAFIKSHLAELDHFDCDNDGRS
jgi:hypothetical protein